MSGDRFGPGHRRAASHAREHSQVTCFPPGLAEVLHKRAHRVLTDTTSVQDKPSETPGLTRYPPGADMGNTPASPDTPADQQKHAQHQLIPELRLASTQRLLIICKLGGNGKLPDTVRS